MAKDGHEPKVRVQGQLVFNSSAQILKAALAHRRMVRENRILVDMVKKAGGAAT